MASDTQVAIALAFVIALLVIICVVTARDYTQRRKLVKKVLEEINKPKLKV